MKRILLVLGILLFSLNSVFSQEYKIEISGYIGQGSSSCGTLNGLRGVILIYRNGTRTDLHPYDYYINKNYSYTRTFSKTNPVVKVEFFTRARHKTTIGDCRSGKEARKSVNVSFPCNSKRYTKDQIYQGRINNGYAQINVYPILNIKHPDGSLLSKTKTVCETGSIPLASTVSGHSSPNTVYKWEFLDPVNKITVQTAGYKVLLNRLETAKQRWEDCINFNGGGGQIPRAEEKKKKEDKLQGRPPGGGGDCSYYMEQVMDLRSQVNAYTPKTEQVSIWRPITNKNGQSSISLSLSDLYSNSADQKKALNNKKIWVRINPGCNNTKAISAGKAVVQFLPEPPKVAKAPTFNQPLCSYSDVNGFVLYFDRQLYSHEKIEINLKRKFLSGDYVPEDKNVNIRSLTRVNSSLYKYIWQSSVGESIKGGDYRIEVSGFDKNNNSPFCKQYIYDFKITVPKPITYNVAKIQNEFCYNSKDGKIKITAQGGTGTFKYSLNNGTNWNPSTFTGEVTITGLAPDTYKVVVKDTNGCLDKTKSSVTVVISSISKITHTASVDKHPSALGQSDGSIKINNLKGGTPISNYYNYIILNNGNVSDVIKTGKAYINNTFTGLPAGTHKIVYTDKNGCTQEYALPTLIDPEPIKFTITSASPDCNGANNGKITISNIKGGYPPYKIIITQIGGAYNKTLSNIGINTTVNENVSAGNYKVIVKDSRLIAVLEKPITVNNRSKVEITKVEASPILCNGNNSTIKITAIGGKTGSYQYAIYKPSGMVWQNSNTFILPANSNVGYSFQVRDRVVANCKSVVSTPKKISEPTFLEVVNSSTIVEHNNIFGQSNGKITLTIDGGTPNYTVNWTKRGDVSLSKSGNPVIGLSAGFYTATVTDGNGCFIISEEVEVKENAELITTLSIKKEINCNGNLGSLLANTQGGSENYTYEWFKDGVLISGETTNALNDIVFGNYSIKAYDNYTNTSASITLINVPKLELQVTKENITCFGKEDGTIKITPSGGSGGYLYSIDDKSSPYQPISGLTNNTISGLVKGSYKVWLKDKNDCEITTPTNVVIDEPTEIKINSFSITNCDTTGGNEGEVLINTSGGEGTLLYTWTKNGDATFLKITKKITGLYAGLYNVSIKDASNCELIKSFEVKEPLPIQVSIKKTTEISCFNGSNGSLLAEVTGGYPINSTSLDFDYKWYIIEGGVERMLNADVTLNSLSDLVAGKYKVVVNDIRGATTSAEFTLNEPAKIEISLQEQQDVSCFEGADGKINISVNGGVSGYTYVWTKEDDVSFSKTTEDIDNLTQGKYKVEVKDINECKITSTIFEIKQPVKPLYIQTSNIVNLTGFETDNGSISVEITGGTPSYTYEWRVEGIANVIGTNSKKENLKIGKYEVTIKDSKGCELIETYSVTQPALLEITSISQSTDILCFGDKGINLSSEVKGGVKPYTYSWSLKGSAVELANGSTLNNIGSGIYVLSIIDANLIKVSREYNLIEPLLLEPSIIKIKDVSCNGGTNGRIEVEGKGGTGPYTYNWNHGETGNVLMNLSSGKYTVIIRDKNLCETTKEIVVSEPLLGLFVKNEIKTDVTGNGLSNGSIEVEIKGGTPPYAYEWKNDSGIILSSTTNVLSEIIAGDYTLVVTDTKMCELTLNYTITEPLPLIVEVNEAAVLCKGEKGLLITTISGGIEPYTYTWYNSNGIVIGTDSNLNYIAGTYSLEVMDAKNNSKRINNINITEPLLLDVASIDINNVLCYQGNGGSIIIDVTGGVKPYNYKWNHSSIDSNEITALKAGLYTVKVTDKNGCAISKENIEVLEPLVYDIIETKLVRPSNSSVNNGSIYVKIVGGLQPYNYVWKDENNLEISNKTTSVKSDKIENLTEGTYKVIITDSKGCVTEETYNLADPGELLVSITQTQEISCFGGSNAIIDVIPVGGVGGNNYTWYNAITGIIEGTNKLLENISAGQYYVVVNNLEGIEEQSAVFTVNEPTQVKITGAVNNLSCFESNDGTISLNITGGSSTYEYRYRLQGNSFSNWVEVKNNPAEIKELQVGVYGVQLRDSNNCYAININGADEYLYTINQPKLFSVLTEVIEEPTGFGVPNGSILVSVEEQAPPYNYIWKKEGSVISNKTTNSVNNTINSLNAGTYTVIVTNSKGCKAEKTYVLEEPLKLEASIGLTAVINCKGEENGALQANVTGGVLNYTYKWFEEGDTTVLGTEKELSNLGESKYYVEIEDSKGNTTRSSSYELLEPETLTVELNSDYVLCGIDEDWTVTPIISGGTAPYSYLWSTGSNKANLENVKIGTYELTVVDANGCRSNINTTLVAPVPLRINKFELIIPTCYGGNDGKITLDITGGASPYNIEWSNELKGSTIEDLSAGVYEVLITDIKGCTYTSNFEIKNPEKIEFDLGETVTLCKGQTYVIDASIEKGIKYEWLSDNGFSSSSAIVEVSKSGIYNVKITTDLGCVISDSVEIKQSTAEINSQFTMSSQVYTNESFVIVNFSDPKPDEVVWFFPSNAKVIEENENYAEILIEEEGEYEITLISKLGDCEEFITKKILVLDKEIENDDSDDNLNTSILSTAMLYPNPSSGKFNLDIELNKVSPISLKFYRMNSTIIKKEEYEGEDVYKLSYDFNLTPGVYFLLIETKAERVIKKIIVL